MYIIYQVFVKIYAYGISSIVLLLTYFLFCKSLGDAKGLQGGLLFVEKHIRVPHDLSKSIYVNNNRIRSIDHEEKDVDMR